MGKIADRVQETTTTTGTGTYTTSNTALTGYRTFASAFTNGDTVEYAATDGTNWEVGEGVLDTTAHTITRGTIRSSSNAGAAVNWGAGTRTIWSDASAYRVANADTAPLSGITGLGTNVSTFIGAPSSANLAAAVTDETGSGALVFATSPTLVTPVLGTPASGVLTNCTGTASGLTAGNASQLLSATWAAPGDIGTTTRAKGEFSNVGIGAAGVANAMLIVAGSLTGNTAGANAIGVTATLSPVATYDSQALYFAPTINTAASGTHANLNGVRLDAPTFVAGGATVTNANTLWINGAPTIATTNYAIRVDGNGKINTLETAGYTVATLPAGKVGMRAYVTDATAPTYNAALAGGGAVTVPVFYNGAAWVSA